MLMPQNLFWAKQFNAIMLRLFYASTGLDFTQLQQIYRENENDFFYEDTLDFLAEQENAYAVWVENRAYKSALRWQRFRDGYLIAGIETLPEERRKGYANELLNSVLRQFQRNGDRNVYSHIRKNNAASVALHKLCGFEHLSDCACLLDGSVSNQYYTYRIKI